MLTTLTLPTVLLPGGNSTVVPHLKSTDKYQSDSQNRITKTASGHNAKRVSTNRTTSMEYTQRVSMTELYSSKIVTAPIASTVNGDYSSVKLSQTGVLELASSMYRHASNATVIKSLSNSTKIFSQPDATKTKRKVSNVSTSRTSEYARETSKLLPTPASAMYARPNKTNIANTSIILERTVNLSRNTSSANSSGYNSTMVLPNNAASPRLSSTNLLSPSTVQMANKSSFGPSGFLLPNVTRGISNMNFITASLSSKLNISSGTILFRSSIQKAERKITSTTVNVSQNTSAASRSQSDAFKVRNTSAFVKVATMTTTLEGNSSGSEHYGSNAAYTSRIGLQQSSIVLNASTTKTHLSSFTPVPSLNTMMWTVNSSKSFYTIHLAPSTRGNIFKRSTFATGHVSTSVSRHLNRTSRVNDTAVVYSTSPLPTLTLFSEQIIKNTTTPLLDGNHTTELMFSESILLIKSTTKTNLSSSTNVPSADSNMWNVNSSKPFNASTSNDLFRRSTVVVGNVYTSVSRHPNRTSRVNNTIVYSTSPLPTLTLFSEQITKNTTTPSLLEGNHTTELMFSKSIYSTTEKMSSMSFEVYNTSKSNSTVAFLDSISPSYYPSVDTKAFTRFSSVGQAATKSKVILTQSWTKNLSSSILVSNPSPVLLPTVSSEFKNLTSFPSKTVSTSSSLSIARFNSSNTPFWSKSLSTMHMEVDQSPTLVSNYVQVSTKKISNITNVLKTTNPVSYTIVRSLSSSVQTTSLSVPPRSSKINSVSLVPIYTSCYISYMVTVSRRVEQSLVSSVVDFETGITSTIEKPSPVHYSNNQSLTHSSPLQPTPSTRFLHLNSSTEMSSKTPTQSLSRLPVYSVGSMHNATTTKHNTRSVTMKTSHYTRTQNFTYNDSSMSNVPMSSFVLRGSTVSSNLTPDIRNRTTFLHDQLKSSLVRSTPAQKASLTILKSINTSIFSITSRSVDKYDDFNVSSTTTTNFIPVTSTSPMFTDVFPSNFIGRSLIPSYSVSAESKRINTNATKSGTRASVHGQSLNSESNSVSIVSSSGEISRSFSWNETLKNTGTKNPALSTTRSVSTRLKMSLSTSSTKQIGQSNIRTVNNSYLQASPSPLKSLIFRKSSQNIVTSLKIEANHLLDNGSNRTATSYYEKRNTTLQLLPSSLSFKLTTFQFSRTVISTVVNMTTLETNTKSIRNENQNRPQSKLVLSRTRTLPLSNTSNSTTSTLLNIPANLTLLPSNMSVLSAKLPSTRVFPITPSVAVASGHITDASSVGVQNLSLKATETIPTKGIQLNLTNVIEPTVVLNTGSILKSVMTSRKNDPISNSSLFQATSSYASLNATPSFSTTSKVEPNPLHRKRRDLRNLNFTKTPTLNMSMLAVNDSSWKIISIRTAVINSTMQTPNPLVFNTSSLEKLSITSTSNLPLSRAANESRLLADEYISTNMPTPTASAKTKHSNRFVVPKPTSSASRSTVQNSMIDETYLLSKNFTLIVSSAMYAINESRPLRNISASESLSRGITSEPHNTSIAEGSNNRYFNRSNLTPTNTQQQLTVITKSTLTHHSRLLIPSMTKDKKSVYITRTVTNSTIMSTSSIVGMVSNASNVDYSLLISTTKSASRPNITSISHEIYIAKENASESILNTSMSTSINIGKNSYSPTIPDSSYTFTTQYNSNSTVHSISAEEKHQTATHTFKPLVSTQIMESLVVNSTSKIAPTQTLARSSLYPITNTTVNTTAANNNVRTESIVIVVKSINSRVSRVNTMSSINAYFQNASETMQVSYPSISLRPTQRTAVGNETLILTASPATTIRALVTAQELSSYQLENISGTVTSNHKQIPSSTVTLNFTLSSIINLSQASLPRTKTLVDLRISHDTSHQVFSQSSENITSLTVASSVAIYFNNGTSSVHKSISLSSSTILTQHIRITPSPSPSFSIAGSKAIILTPTLPERNYSSPETILEQSSSLITTDRVHSFTVNTSAIPTRESSAVLSPILDTKSESNAVVRSTNQSAEYFTYHVIPTSSLGLCLVSYSTVFINDSRQSPGTRIPTSLLNWTTTVQTSTVSSFGEINSTGILASTTLTSFNASSTTLLYLSLNRTFTVVKPSVHGSYVINKSSILSSSRSQNLSSAVNTMLLKISMSSSVKKTPSPNVSYLGQSRSEIIWNVSSPLQLFTMTHSKSSSSHASHINISVLPSPTSTLTSSIGKSSIHSQLLDTESYISTANIAASMSPQSLTFTVYQISPTLSSVVAPTSVPTTHPPTSTVDENSVLLIVLAVNENVNVENITFKTNIEEKLNKVYQTGRFAQRQRSRRSTVSSSSAKVML